MVKKMNVGIKAEQKALFTVIHAWFQTQDVVFYDHDHIILKSLVVFKYFNTDETVSNNILCKTV